MYEELISRWAKERPDGTAVVLPRAAVSYAEFEAQINKVAWRLGALGLPAQARVAVHVGDEYLHALVMLALDRLGLPSISLVSVAPRHPVLELLKPDLMLTNFTSGPRISIRTVQIDQPWFDETMTMPAERPARARSPDEIVRFLASTGTTGAPKLMALRRSTVAARVEVARAALGIAASSRGSVLLGQGTAVGYARSLSFWAAGASAVLNLHHTGAVLEALRRAEPTHLCVAVGTLLQLVRGLKASRPALPETRVIVSGSTLPAALAKEAREMLSPEVWVDYGASEAGLIAVASSAVLRQHEGTVGHVLPSAEVQAVDEAGRVLPPGAAGILRVRGTGMASGYLSGEGEDKAVASGLIDGWFYPGDMGSVSIDGLLMLEGRVNDVMNIGGNKFAPQAIEAVALACAGIRDAAAFSVPDGYGVEMPWLAVVRGADHKSGEVLATIKARWPLLARLQVAVVEEIPRNHLGKIDRSRLKQQGLDWMAAAERQATGPRT
jgi:acyl-CoA synthetase (AMP-forming)/AMP-acid ligase II